jgi:hypothetical protein
MKQVILKVPDKNYNFFMELIKNLDFVKKVEENDEPTREQILQDIKESVKEVNLIKAGKLKGIPAKDILREL